MNLLTIFTLAVWFDMTPDGIKQRYYRDPTSLPPAIRIGRSLRWDPETVREWLKEREEVRTEIRTSSEIPDLPVGTSHAER